MICREIINSLEQLAPARYAESFDNVGLLVGHKEKQVSKIMLALDASEDVIDQCVEQKVDLLITHHPIIFSPLKRLNWDDLNARRVMKLLENNIACYAIHTNFDIKVMAEEAARKLNLSNPQILQVTHVQKYKKLVVYVPTDSVDKVRAAMTHEGAGFIGNYSDCTFGAKGTGSFKPLEGTNPYIGKQDELTFTDEVRLETIVKEEDLNRTIQAMLRVHPYEEVAYDIYNLENEVQCEGIGRYGYLKNDMTLSDLVNIVKNQFGVSKVKVWGDVNRKVASVAISPGAGKSMIKDAKKAKVDVFITGDIDHHEALDCVEEGLMIIDAGHFGTEYFMVDIVKEYLKKFFASYTQEEGVYSGVEILVANEKEPFTIL